MSNRKYLELCKRLAAQGGIIAFFIMAFEVMIMISPFAFFFYSVFNPVLHWLDNHWITGWLTSFFLPHMILPPTFFLVSIRIMGSILFIVGSLGFIACAAQIYLGKLFKCGVADRGIYASIRHPQYLFLGIWGMGMAILWPRFLVLATLSMMFVLYYFLALDEQKRMTALYGDKYLDYMKRTGMFLPKSIESKLVSTPFLPGGGLARHLVVALGTPIVVIGIGFLLREVTLNSLRYQTGANLTLVSILPEDNGKSRMALAAMLGKKDPAAAIAFLAPDKDYLGYVMPPDYVMQGMIADTGDTFHLHKKDHTFALIADWVLHPFEHLRRSPSTMMAEMNHVDPALARKHHCPLGITDQDDTCANCPYRRIVFVEVDAQGGGRLSREGVFQIGAKRTPVGFVDINTATGEIISQKSVGKATAWRDVPTPAL